MARDFDTSYLTELNSRRSAELQLVFITISPISPQNFTTIRVVNDGSAPGGRPIEFIRDGETWVGVPFQIKLLTDDDRPPRGSIGVLNVNQEIGLALDGLTSSPRVKIELFRSTDFQRRAAPDDHQFDLISGRESKLTADYLRLRNIDVDGVWAQADLVSWEVASEPYPGVRATQNRLPGLFV